MTTHEIIGLVLFGPCLLLLLGLPLHEWWVERRRPVMTQCACGLMRVAPGTRVEVNLVSHGETPCFQCDEYGQRRKMRGARAIDVWSDEQDGVT